MLIRFVWPNCDLVNDSNPMDYFWVECTKEEASEHVFPILPGNIKTESIKYTEFDGSENNRSYCYLITADLSHVIAKPAFFPFAGQWNAFNPFRELSETYDINALDKLQPIDVIYATPDDG